MRHLPDDHKQEWVRFYSMLNRVASEVMTETMNYTIDFKRERAYMVKWDSSRKEYRRLSKKEIADYYSETGEAPYNPKEEFEFYSKMHTGADETWILSLILEHLVRRTNYEVKLSFFSPAYPIGSLDVKFGDKWFAFGEAEQEIADEEGDEDSGQEEPESYMITAVWPLKRASKLNFETHPEYQVSISDTWAMGSDSKLYGEAYHREQMSKETNELFDRINNQIQTLFPGIEGPNYNDFEAIYYIVGEDHWLSIYPEKEFLTYYLPSRTSKLTKEELSQALSRSLSMDKADVEFRPVGAKSIEELDAMPRYDIKLKIRPHQDVSSPEFRSLLLSSYNTMRDRAR